MGLQLIFVVETNARCKSDWIYIKDTIEHFYQYDRTQIKLSCVYLDGKGKYEKKRKDVSSLISQYASTSRTNRSKAIYCFDCDDYDSSPADLEFLRRAQQYCICHEADFVWFCRDIECVYLGKKVDKSRKKTESAGFKLKKLINKVDDKRLSASSYQADTSNIMSILDRYLPRKSAPGGKHPGADFRNG